MGIFDGFLTSESSSTTNATKNPWAPATPALTSLLGGVQGLAGNTNPTGIENNAFAQMLSYANAGNPYASSINDYAKTMLAGGGPDRTGIADNAYNQFQTQMGATANGDYLDPNKNPWFGTTTNTIANDIQNRVNGMFAGAGRDLSGANQYNLSRGLSEGLAPVFAQQYQQERTNQLGAQNALYGAGNSTAGLLSGLDQTRLANRGAGVEASSAANKANLMGPEMALEVEAARRGIPVSLLSQLAGIAAPIASLGGTTNSTTTGTQTQSPFSAMVTLGGMLKSPQSGGQAPVVNYNF